MEHYMKKMIATAVLASLYFITTPVLSASKPPANTIWEFKGDKGKTLWQVCGGENSSCKIVGSTQHYVAVLNHRSSSGCAFGDFYIVARTDGKWEQRDTGTCSPNAYVTKGSMNNGQYMTVDIGVGNTIVKRFPIEYWSMQKRFSGSNRPKWKEIERGRGGVEVNQ